MYFISLQWFILYNFQISFFQDTNLRPILKTDLLILTFTFFKIVNEIENVSIVNVVFDITYNDSNFYMIIA